MLKREVEFKGDEKCENCGHKLNTKKGETTWRESPQLILICQQCRGSYEATLSRDVTIIEQS